MCNYRQRFRGKNRDPRQNGSRVDGTATDSAKLFSRDGGLIFPSRRDEQQVKAPGGLSPGINFISCRPSFSPLCLYIFHERDRETERERERERACARFVREISSRPDIFRVLSPYRVSADERDPAAETIG